MKKTISPSDYFEIRKVSLIDAKDYEYALDLYAPLIGIKNVSVYFAMVQEESNVILKHSEMFLKYRLSSGEFQSALSYLEAIGLIASYYKDGRYIYALNSPRTPSQFFNSELLYGTLRSNISEEECQKIRQKYRVDDVPTDCENVSERFIDVFHPDLDNVVYAAVGPKTGDHSYGTLSLGFDFNAFKESLYQENPYLKMNFFSKEEIGMVEDIAALYSYEESAMASFVARSYVPSNPKGKRIDFDRLKELAHDYSGKTYLLKKNVEQKNSDVHGSSDRAKLVRKMDKLSPKLFLSNLQGGRPIARPDEELINRLVQKMMIPDSVVNALLYHVLKTKNNILANNYVERLAGSLSRENFNNALDALEYLENNFKNTSMAANISSKQKTSFEPKIESAYKQSQKEENELSDEEIDALLRS